MTFQKTMRQLDSQECFLRAQKDGVRGGRNGIFPFGYTNRWVHSSIPIFFVFFSFLTIFIIISLESIHKYINSIYNIKYQLFMYQTIQSLCFLVGTYTVLCFLFRLIRPMFMFQHNLYKRYGGGWAVVTGGTDGIGLGYCEQLAKLGFNICIISRTQQKLQRTQKEMKELNPNIETKVIRADFSKSLEDNFFEDIMQKLNGIDISILVNNVGTMNIGQYEKIDISDIKKQLSMNLMPIAMLTRYIIPQMRKREHKSAIINLSSMASTLQLYSAVGYCSSKLYDDFISRALSYQYNSKIDIQSLKPFYVTTPLTRNVTSLIHINKNQCAKGSLKELGRSKTTFGHWNHNIQAQVSDIFDDWIKNLVSKHTVQTASKIYEKIDAGYSVVK